MSPEEQESQVAAELSEAGYIGLFLSGDHSRADAVWRDGERRPALEQIAWSGRHGDLAALLASEVLYRKAPGYPPEERLGELAPVYARALAITGDDTGPLQLTGNEWGFMYHADERGGDAHGELGGHLLRTGTPAVPHLAALLDDPKRIFYVGSQDATLGNRLGYRVKDAAAYYLGKLTGTAVRYHDDPGARDAEIDRLRSELGGAG